MAKKFIRKDAHKKKRVPENWRRPKGITNKMRLKRKGHPASVRPGYGTKDSERGKNRHGLFIVQVSNLWELRKLDPKADSALLANIGRKKKMELIAEAEKLGITLSNLNVKAFRENTAKFLAEKKKETTERKEEKKQAEKEAEKKAKEKEEEEKKAKAEETPEEKKKAEKEEMDKILTKAK
jgi:large subunit ribosomal protein L32e